jgi:hypothetical protein
VGLRLQGNTYAHDTSPDADRVQTGLLRKAGAAGRFKRMRSLSRSVMALSRRAIARSRPAESNREHALAFVALHYGTDLAGKVRRYLAEKNQR